MADSAWQGHRRENSLPLNRPNKGKAPEHEHTEELPNKTVMVQYHITGWDFVRRPKAASLSLPNGTASRRDVQPLPIRESKPGTHNFDAAPTLVKTPWEVNRWKGPKSKHVRNSKRRSSNPHKLEQLPKEILHCIIDRLRVLHSSGSMLDVVAYRSDLKALCVTNQRLLRLARESLYGELWLPSNHEKQRTGLSMRKPNSQLSLLLRTLKISESIATMVRHLRVSANLAAELELETTSYGSRQLRKDSSTRLTCEIIQQCYNLEHFTGYAAQMLGSPGGLFGVLNSCSRMKSHAWRIPQSTTPVPMQLTSNEILGYHIGWRNIETLVLFQAQSGCDMGTGLVSAIVQRLPSLKHLGLSGLPPSAFHNGTLLALPPLESLRLDNLPGLTDQGVEQISHSRLAMSIENLTLSGLELTSLQTLQMLLRSLARLRSLSFHQDTSPEIPSWISATSPNFSLQSDTLQYLYWDVLTPGSNAVILANSIAAGKFPGLRTVNVPCDYDGAIQNLCRPTKLQPVSEHDIMMLRAWEQSSNYRRSLRVSQVQAQLRIRRERRQPAVKVVVEDEDEAIMQTHVIGSYLGNMASLIEYSLEPAIEGTESAIAKCQHVLMPWTAPRERMHGGGEEFLLDLSDIF